jgi:hypothetical protein
MSWFTRKSLFWGRLSLAETLMLLFVFAILAAILFPVYSNGGPTHRTGCISNVKQLAVAMQFYFQDNNERFPLRDNWMDATKDYRKNDDMLRCPTLAREKTAPKNQYGYAMNQAMSGAKEPEMPGKVPLVFDSINLARNASGTLESLPDPPRHVKVNYIGYADGHAGPLSVAAP